MTAPDVTPSPPAALARPGGIQRRPLRWLALGGLALLGGCASARVTDLAEAGGGGTAPAAILVETTSAAPVAARDAGVSSRAAAALERDLITRLSKSGLAAAALGPGPTPRGDAVLHVAISQADPGDRAERLLVGFGLGRSVLQVRTTLDSPSGATSTLAFDTASDSGRKPGLILPGGVAAITGNAAHLAIGGAVDVALTARGGLDRDADRTAKAIVTRLKAYYASMGWSWAAAPRA